MIMNILPYETGYCLDQHIGPFEMWKQIHSVAFKLILLIDINCEMILMWLA